MPCRVAAGRVEGAWRSAAPAAEPSHRLVERVADFLDRAFAGRDAFVVANEIGDALDAIGRLSVAEFAARGTADEALFELRSLAGSIRRHFLGHELKSFEVLASVVART